MITVDAWLPASGGSYQDISLTSNYQGLFLSDTALVQTGNVQFEQIAASSGYLRGVMATTGVFPVAFFKKPGFSSQTFHTNMRAWFSPYETARATGYLQVVWEDGSTDLRIPCRVESISTIPNVVDAYQVMLRAEQPHFEETSETSDSSSPISNAGNVRCGAEVELTGANIANCAYGTASGDFTGRVLLVDTNVTPTSSGRMFVNGVPVPWETAGSAHAWVLVAGEDPTIEYIPGFDTTDPLYGLMALTQLNSAETGDPYNYDDMQISTLVNDSKLGGLWRPTTYLPTTWPAPATGWGYYAEDSSDGFKLYLNDTPSFGTSGAWPYNAVYLDSGGPRITAVTSWDVTLADFTSSEARASLLGRARGSDVWVELWGSDSNGSTAISPSMSGDDYTELMWTIVPLTDTLTTDPSLIVNPDTSNTLTMGSVLSMSTSSTRYKRLDGTFTNSTTGETITFDDFVARDKINLHTPSRRHGWDIALDTAGLVCGWFEYSDPDRGFELEAGDNTISNGTGGSYTIKHRGGYA